MEMLRTHVCINHIFQQVVQTIFPTTTKNATFSLTIYYFLTSLVKFIVIVLL
jgi:hypothetical protein